MPWFNVDDGFADHPKTIRVGNAAVGLWVRTGSWCAKQLTDGFVPGEIASLYGTPAQAGRLVAAGLWKVVEGGYQFHDWEKEGRNPTRKEVEKRRRSEAERKARWRERNAPNSGQQQVDEGSPTGTPPSVPPSVPPVSHYSTPLHSTPKEAEKKTASSSLPDELFEDFWAAYPRKVGKAAAEKAWPKACKKLEADRIVKAAVYWAGLWANAKTDVQFIPHPATWLNGRRWDDDPPAPKLQAVSGGYVPYSDPEDPADYYEGF